MLVSTPEYHSVRVEVSLDRLEDIAGSDSVYFIQPKMEYMLNDVTTTPGPVDRIRADSSFNARAERVRAQLTRALAKPADDDKPIDPGFLASVGSRQSEGDVTHRANTARGRFQRRRHRHKNRGIVQRSYQPRFSSGVGRSGAGDGPSRTGRQR